MMDDDYGFMPAESVSSGPIAFSQAASDKQAIPDKVNIDTFLGNRCTTRHEASEAFFGILQLACRGEIKVRQDRPYGTITII